MIRRWLMEKWLGGAFLFPLSPALHFSCTSKVPGYWKHEKTFLSILSLTSPTISCGHLPILPLSGSIVWRLIHLPGSGKSCILVVIYYSDPYVNICSGYFLGLSISLSFKMPRTTSDNTKCSLSVPPPQIQIKEPCYPASPTPEPMGREFRHL